MHSRRRHVGLASLGEGVQAVAERDGRPDHHIRVPRGRRKPEKQQQGKSGARNVRQDGRAVAWLEDVHLPRQLELKIGTIARKVIEKGEVFAHGLKTDRLHYGASTISRFEKSSDAMTSPTAQVTGISRTTNKTPTRQGYLPLMRESDDQRYLRMRASPQIRANQSRTNALASNQYGHTPQEDDQTFLTETRVDGFMEHGDDLILGKKRAKFQLDEEIVTKIMMQMSSEDLKNLKRDFKANGDQLTLKEFVSVMMKYQPRSNDYDWELRTISQLSELFTQVDINGDGTMEWDEFTSFIIESSHDRDYFRVDNIKKYNPSEVKEPGKLTHGVSIDRVHVVDELDRLVVCESSPLMQGKKSMHIYDARSFQWLQTAHGHEGVVHGVDYLSGKGAASYLVTCANDSTIGFWDTVNYSLCQQMPTREVQMALEWSGAHYNRLFSGGASGVVNVWDVDELRCLSSTPGHSDMVMDLHSVPSMDVIASASLDTKINLWDIPTQSLRKSLFGHSKGVFSLSYAPEYRFLLSAGFDHDALVWNPYVETLICRLKGHTCSLVGVEVVKNSPEIITADCSGVFKVWDIRNFSCVQTFSMSDSLSSSEVQAGNNRRSNRLRAEPKLSCFAYSNSHKRIAAANTTIKFFDYDQPANPFLSDRAVTVCCLVNLNALTMITASATSIKLWDAETGRLLRIYRDLCQTEILSMCMDDRRRKVITGDHEGNVVVYNLANGSKLKELWPHEREIVGLEYCPSQTAVISCSIDGVIKIQHESDPEETTVLKTLSHHSCTAGLSLHRNELARAVFHEDDMSHVQTNGKPSTAQSSPETETEEMARTEPKVITCMAYSPELGLLSTGCADSSISIWDLGTGNVEGLYFGLQAEITSLIFLETHKVLLSTDNDGNVMLWALKSSLVERGILFSFRPGHLRDQTGTPCAKEQVPSTTGYQDDDDNIDGFQDIYRTVPINAAAWNDQTSILYAGTAAGEVLIVDLRETLDNIKAVQSAPTRHVANREPRSGDLSSDQAGLGIRDRARASRPSHKKAIFKESLRTKHETNAALASQNGSIPMPRVLGKWSAHQDAIKSIRILHEISAVSSTSYDNVVRIWSLQGTLLGTLYQGSSESRYVDHEWKVNVDRNRRDMDTLNKARTVLNELRQGKHFSDSGPFGSSSKPSPGDDQHMTRETGSDDAIMKLAKKYILGGDMPRPPSTQFDGTKEPSPRKFKQIVDINNEIQLDQQDRRLLDALAAAL